MNDSVFLNRRYERRTPWTYVSWSSWNTSCWIVHVLRLQADCIDRVDFVACPSWSLCILSDDTTLLTAAKMIATSAKDATLKLSKIRVGVLDFKFIDGVTSHVWCMCATQSIYTLWFNTCITRSTNTTVTYCTTVSTTVNCRTSKCDWKVQVRYSGTSTVVIFMFLL